MESTLCKVVEGLTFCCFYLLSNKSFRRPRKDWRTGAVGFIWILGTISTYFNITKHQTESPSRLIAATTCNIASVALFLWVLLYTNAPSKRPLAACFSESFPSLIHVDGPFSLCRHPVYFSYLLKWTATSLATDSWLQLMFPVLMVCIYTYTAKTEEEFILRGSKREEYVFYSKKTPMFIPFMKM
ncbi:hypothetical protein PROFUN_11947 [Planoprotostelium fungivorum]|uniref:Protein-S-isoprenylcysteine O-methyltransferase n=1 Tax=Planoprotostelium fungivorum TaxID=1890364 RepID=A0A2P6N8Y1_9EUKA|nr:hypothetical protein PROFUN_11947 [Planoprotostelium fungivorum]